MKKDIITVITPSYNQGQFIEQTIRSIWDQEGDFSIQHIIADGGSTDQTTNVIKKLENDLLTGVYPIKCKSIELEWWSKKDNGQASALNEGFKKATGDIFCWLNSDDFFEPGALKKITEYLEAHESTDFIYGDMNFVDINGVITKQCDYLIDFNFWRLQNSCYICQPSTFWRRSVLDKVGLLDERYHYAFDYEYWLRIAINDVKISRVRLGVLSNLRTYKERKTESGLAKQRLETIDIFAKKRLFLNFGFYEAIYIVIHSKVEQLLQKE